MISKTALRATLLDCMDFFRDELYFGTLTPRQEEKFRELRDRCSEALGNPSVADAQRIRKVVAQEKLTCHGRAD